MGGSIPASGEASIPTAPVPTNVADILTAAAEIVAKPGAWTKRALARPDSDSTLELDSALDRRAGCWCVEGAILRAAGEDGDWEPAFEALKDYIGTRALFQWNDSFDRTQAEVVAALRAAAEKARTADTNKLAGYPEGMNP
jgi:hypothetical protein